MKIPKLSLFIFTTIMLLYSCSSSKFVSIQESPLDKISKPRIFNYNFTQALYKTDFTVHKRELSGLLFIKKQDSSFRLVLLSELGLKYLDIEFFLKNDRPAELHYVIDFLARPSVISEIQSDLASLFLNYPDEALENLKKEKSSGLTVAQLNPQNKKQLYFYNLQSGFVQKIIDNGFFRKKTIATFSNYGLSCPFNITLTSGNISWEMKKVEK